MPPPIKRQPTGAPAFLSRIKDIERPTRGIRLGLYGRSGSGKTVLACEKSPKPALYIRPPDDDGRLSISHIPGIKDCPVYTSEEFKEIGTYYRKNGSGQFKTIVVDNCTALQDMVLAKILGVEEVPAQLAWGTASQQQWGEVGAGMKDLLRDILAVQCNIVLIAQEREFDSKYTGSDEYGIAPNIGPALSPTVAGWFGPSVDYLAQTYIGMKTIVTKKKVGNAVLDIESKVPQYYLRVGPHPVYQTKFRVPKGTPLPESIEDPTWDKIKSLIEGKPLPK